MRTKEILMQTTEQDSVREKVRARYGAIAGEADAAIEPGGCCQPAGSTAKASATAEATAKAGASAQGCGCGCSTDDIFAEYRMSQRI